MLTVNRWGMSVTAHNLGYEQGEIEGLCGYNNSDKETPENITSKNRFVDCL